MTKFNFSNTKEAWLSLSGKKWERPLSFAQGSSAFRLFHDDDVGSVDFNNYTADGIVVVDGKPDIYHQENIIAPWASSPPQHKPIMESITEVVEEMSLGKQTTKSLSHTRYDKIVQETFEKIIELGIKKGGEYAGDFDRLANFRRNGINLGLPMETVWGVYAGKHWDAVMQYIKDQRNGTERVRMETIDGRIDDLIVYCLLFKLMLEETNDKV